MSKGHEFTVEVTFHVPVFQHLKIVASSVEEACQKALSCDDWSGMKYSFEEASDSYVSGVWETGEAYDKRSLPIPK